ncbi:HNH endonuclease [Bacillus phage vB_BanS_Sophrita]|uniref:AP2 domain n=1 Tax=Bacillus phage vB_BanS_Sophrita TaxID=2894790 RepID=A0AAE9CE84_9CAUD|nr:HNH endonuclease [Bacillus phage vB_BanS_Sophrita]UGO50657.1 AP2 domain [Bacillus phage vB_BanS_Sophrita]
MKNRVGEVNFNKYGHKMTIVSYNKYSDIVVEFEDGYQVHTGYHAFKKGQVKSLYDRTVIGVGFLGGRKYKITDENNKMTKQYATWREMLKRCYSPKFQKENTTYIGCIVTEEWHNFQNFAKWFDENYYEIFGEQVELDKDILIKGNKVYSPETCVFVPKYINQIFTKQESTKGYHIEKSTNKYRVVGRDVSGKRVSLGLFKEPSEALFVYKTFKEKTIKELANQYIDEIPLKLYNAMITYKV